LHSIVSVAVPAKRALAPSADTMDAAQSSLVTAAGAFQQQLDSFTMVFAGSIISTAVDGTVTTNADAVAWLGLNDPDWLGRVQAATSDQSDGNIYITPNEAVNITNVLPLRDDLSTVPLENVRKFIARWNNTFMYYDMNIRSSADLPAGKDPNFIPYVMLESLWGAVFNSSNFQSQASLESSMLSAVDDVNTAASSQQAGTCAHVVVQITQQLTLTRTAFDGNLQIQNSGDSPLTNVTVQMLIWRSDDPNKTDVASSQFVIGNATTTNMLGGASGAWIVPGKTTSSVSYLFMALRSAAPTANVIYSVGGTLSYVIAGTEFSVSLYPDTITVVPDPALNIKYFWTEQVFGDDPFTPNVLEPSIPFPLAVLI